MKNGGLVAKECAGGSYGGGSGGARAGVAWAVRLQREMHLLARHRKRVPGLATRMGRSVTALGGVSERAGRRILEMLV